MLNDWRSAPIEPKLRAMLGFLEKLTLTPNALAVTDVDQLRSAGLSDDAIEEGIHVCVLFNIYDRVADSLGFQIPDSVSFARSADTLLTRGYQ